MTISDIAKMAGVSSAAVSRYLNGGPLSEQKRAVIQAVVEQTGGESRVALGIILAALVLGLIARAISMGLV